MLDGISKKGSNLFVSRDGNFSQRGARSFNLDRSVSVIDRRPCLTLNYGDSGNYFPWSGMRDELREVRPGLLLGLGSMKIFGGGFNSAVFTLEKQRG